MPKKAPLPSDLSPAQREIMEIVWQHGEVAVSDVRQLLAKTRDVARNTVRTLLERMEVKGWLKHREHRRQFLYSAAVPRQTSIGQRVLDVLNTVCGGSPEALVTAILNHRGLSEAEFERIEMMLNSARENSRKGQSQ